MENTANVNVYLRVRPRQMWEAASPMRKYIDFMNCTDKMFIVENQPYLFDKIFYDNVRNKEVFTYIQPNIERLFDGYNSCILAYGQSGSGKTYTMGLNEKNVGMISLCLDFIFEKIRDNQLISSSAEYSVNASYIEIYNEKVYDLFSEKATDSIHTKGSKYAGSTKIPIQNSVEAKDLLLKGNKIRHTRSTTLNASSSRSHALYTIFLTSKKDDLEKTSVLHLVDLAGSEGLRRTNNSGIAQQEGVFINQGLLTVGRVIQALSSGKKVVPYRESVLTTVLLDCLNLESFFTLIACISPGRKDHSETISTIRFAQSCKGLENKVNPEVSAYLKQQQRVKAQTPLKPYMQSNVRKDMAKTPGKFGMSAQKAPVSSTHKLAVPKTFHSFITPSSKKVSVNKPRYTDLRDITDSNPINIHAPKESIDNHTFNISNVSCSTELEGPTTCMSLLNPSIQSYQNAPAMPSFSPLMKRIEETIDRKLQAFMTSFRNETVLEGTTIETGIVHQQLKDAVKMGIEEVRRSLNIEETVTDESVSLEVTSFPVCSTVLRVPQDQNNDVTNPNFKRTNRRLMTIDLTENTPAKSQESSEIKQFMATTMNDFVEKTVIQVRRSTRIEMKKANITAKVENKVPPKVKRPLVKNKIVAAYLADEPEKSMTVTKKDHKNAIMDVINSGSLKEISMLPTIGSKTAYQIITYRAVKGKFKTLNDVKKALDVKEKTWKKFLEKNLLD